jgi:hypothetical protein
MDPLNGSPLPTSARAVFQVTATPNHTLPDACVRQPCLTTAPDLPFLLPGA